MTVLVLLCLGLVIQNRVLRAHLSCPAGSLPRFWKSFPVPESRPWSFLPSPYILLARPPVFGQGPEDLNSKIGRPPRSSGIWLRNRDLQHSPKSTWALWK